MYYDYTEEELRAMCRTNIETLEMWARRLIHEKMVEKHGKDYIDKRISGDNYLVKRDVRDHVHQIMQNAPDRFSRPVDTLFFEHIVYFLCNPEFYRSLFGEALKYAYPQGCDEAREFLNRLIPVRNQLSHANPISIRDAERAVCYSHDFVEGLKRYYKDKGVERMWNVPQIVRITDSFGNTFSNIEPDDAGIAIYDISQDIYCGDKYSVEIEVDSSFDSSEYDIIWIEQGKKREDFRNKTKFSVFFSEPDVGTMHLIECQLIQKKKWHKYGTFDCEVILNLRVYPPMERINPR